ncbi:MAG: SDR family NAD(P)-dependent oxidoreductase [Pseudonocardiaceae bacterium]
MLAVERCAAVEVFLGRRNDLVDWVAVELPYHDPAHPRIVLYIVPAPGVDPDTAELTAIASVAESGLSVRAVAVNHIPRDAGGQPELECLAGVPVVGHPELQVYRSLLDDCGVRATAVELAQREVPLTHRDAAEFFRASLSATGGTIPDEQGEDDSATVIGSSYCEGGPLPRSEGDPQTLVEALLRAGRDWPDRGLTVVSDEGDLTLTYPALLDRALRILSGLRHAGLRTGDSLLICTTALDEYFPALWAAILGGAQPVTVAAPRNWASGDPVFDKLCATWRSLGQPLLITGVAERADVVRVDPFGPPDPHQQRVLAARDLENHLPADEVHQANPADVVVVQLSSGSTGVPKMIPVTHRGVIDMAIGYRARRVATEPETLVNWLPLDHVGGLVWAHLGPIVMGMNNVHAVTDFVLADPRRWLDLLSRHRAQHTWAPNFAYRLVAETLARGPGGDWDLSGMRTWVNGGEQCTVTAIDDFLHQTAPYGATAEQFSMAFGMAETCTGVTYKSYAEPGSVRRVARSSLGGFLVLVADGDDEGSPEGSTVSFLSVGRVEPGVEMCVVDDAGRDVGELRTGRLCVRSSRVTPGYLGDNQADGQPHRDDSWFDTGDLAFVVDGEVVITGRAKDVIVVNGNKYYNHAIEERLGTVAGLKPGAVAVCGIPSPKTGTEEIGVFFVRDPEYSVDAAVVARSIRDAMASSLRLPAKYVVSMSTDQWPRTTSGKIQRAVLRDRFLHGEYDDGYVKDEVPDCMFTTTWVVTEPRSSFHERPGRTTLIVADDVGLAERLLRLRATGDHPVLIHDAPHYQRTGDTFRFPLRSEADWLRTVREITGSGHTLDRVLTLRSYFRASVLEAQPADIDVLVDRCAAELLACYRAIQAEPLVQDRLIELVTVSRQLYRVTGAESVCFPAAPMAAITAGIPLEAQCWDARNVDLEGVDPQQDARDLAVAIAENSVDRCTAWRAGLPYVPRFARVDPSPSLPAIREQGCYLVAGGAGGIGNVLIADLVDRWNARVLVIGRRELDGGDPASTSRRDALSTIATRGDVTYAAVDVTDGAALTAAVDAAEARWGQTLDGVIHLAGDYRTGLLVEESEQSWNAAIRSKTRGTLELAALLPTRPGARFIAFSSLAGIADVAGCVAYAAANRFLESFCEHLRTHRIPTHCLSWGPWDGLGMASFRGDNDHRESAHGVLSLRARDARLLMLAALAQPEANYLIGLHPGSIAMSTRTTGTPGTPVRALRVPVVRGLADPATELPVFCAAGGEPVPVVTADVAPDTAPTAKPQGVGRRGIRDDVLAMLRAVTGEEVDASRRFDEMGLGSIHLLQAVTGLRSRLGRDLPVTALFDHPTVDDLVAFLDLRSAPEAAEEITVNHDERLAIVGMAIKFPGAADVDEHWANMHSGTVSVRSPREDEHGGYFTLAGVGALDGTDRFDTRFFGMPPDEADGMEPSHRLLLETCHHALEDSGHSGPDQLRRTGLYASAAANTSHLRGVVKDAIRRGDNVDAVFDTADIHTMEFSVARIAHRLGISGPAINVQTASSSASTALHLAGQSLRDGTIDLALVAVAALKGAQFHGYKRMTRAVSITGRSLPFDAAGDGYVRGSAIAAVVLKRLEHAVRDGDTIHSVVLGSALTNDGADRSGFTSPSVGRILDTIRSALAVAGIHVDDVGYVEAQGTGTPVGDLAEFTALATAFQNRAGACPLGTVAVNIGHTDHCSAMAGLVNATLVLKTQEIPPYPGFTRLRAGLDIGSNPFRIVTTPEPWPSADTPRRALVSTFGTGGTNGQIVLEEPPLPAARPAAPDQAPMTGVLPLSAATINALIVLARRYRDHLTAHPDVELSDLVLTLGAGRRHHQHRLAVVGDDLSSLVNALDTFLVDPSRTGSDHVHRSTTPTRKAALVLIGIDEITAKAMEVVCQRYPVARHAVQECDRTHQRLWGDSLIDPTAPDIVFQRFDTVTAMVVYNAWTEVLKSFGVRPSLIACTGAGTHPALLAAGALTTRDALYLAGAVQRSVRDASANIAVRPLATTLMLDDGRVIAQGEIPDLRAIGTTTDIDTSTPPIPADRYCVVAGSDLRESGSPHLIFAATVARLYCAEVDLDWTAVASAGARRIPLPLYPFEDSLAHTRRRRG